MQNNAVFCNVFRQGAAKDSPRETPKSHAATGENAAAVRLVGHARTSPGRRFFTPEEIREVLNMTERLTA